MQAKNTSLVFDTALGRYRFRAMSTLKEAREARGLTQTELAKLANTSQPQIQRLEVGDRKLTKEWAKRLGPHLHISAKELMFGAADEEKTPTTIEVEGGLPVVGTSRAGDWLDITMAEASEHEFETIPVSRNSRFPYARQYALLVMGDSMNKLFTEGTYVICVDYPESGLELKPGMIVHVERTISGRQLVETTVKKVGNGQLLPLSTNPRHQPIPLEGNDDTEIVVRGVIIGKFEEIPFDGMLG